MTQLEPIVSLIIPSRKRIEHLKKLLTTFQENTAKKESLEILICIDDDDDILGYKSMLDEFSDLIIRLIVRPQSWNISLDYYSYMAKRANGKYIWCLNDDCFLMLENMPYSWDDYFYEELKSRDIYDKLFYFNVGVWGHSHTMQSPFPMVSRLFVDALGFIFAHETPTWDADIIIHNTFLSLKKRGYDRIIDARKICIFHMNCAGTIGDEAQANMRKNHRRKWDYDAGCYDYDQKNVRDSAALFSFIVKNKV